MKFLVDAHLPPGLCGLLLVRTGNLSTRGLKRVFEAHLPAIVQALDANSLVELHTHSVQVVV